MPRTLPLAILGLTVLTAIGPFPQVAAAADGPARIPIILDTDIGDDIDDTWALVMLLRSPELDLRLVVTDYGDTVFRARLVAKLLQAAGRPDVPIGVGIRQAENGGPQAAWVNDYSLAQYPGKVHEDGVQALIDTVMAAKEPMTLVAIGPAPNLEAALAREPRIASRLRFAGMYGSIRKGYGDRSKPEPEWNVRAAPSAARAVLQAPWREALVTPLDTCGVVQLKGDRYQRLLSARATDPLVAALFENYAAWCSVRDACRRDAELLAAKSSTLFDTVAVYLAMSHDLLKVEQLGVRVADDGATIVDPAGRPLGWATEWKDLDAFEDLLVNRIAGKAAATEKKPAAGVEARP